jgi:hypothetical protein
MTRPSCSARWKEQFFDRRTEKHQPIRRLSTLNLLELEDRSVPAVTASVDSNNVLTVTLSAPGDHAFISASASGIRVGTTVYGTEALPDTPGIVRIDVVDSGTNASQKVNFDGTSSFSLAGFNSARITSAGIETINLNQAISATNQISGDATMVNVALPGQIQVGINLAATGGTVNVAAGNYIEIVTIDKSVSILGANVGKAGASVSRGAESKLNGTMIVAADGITIDGMAFAGGTHAIRGQGPLTVHNDLTIRNNLIQSTTSIPIQFGFGTGGGISSSNWSITDNKIDNIVGNNLTGMVLFNVDNLTVSGNVINHTNTTFTGRRGINLDGIQTATISGNSIDMGDPTSTFNNTPWAIQLSMSDRPSLAITLAENLIQNTYFGINGLSQRNLSNLSVLRNTIQNVAIGAAFNSGGSPPVASGTTMSNLSVQENFITSSGNGIRLRNLHSAHPNGPVTFQNVTVIGNSLIATGSSKAIEVESGTIITEGAVNAAGNWWNSSV